MIKKKVVLLGDGAVGKTSLMERFVEGSFIGEYLKTVGSVTKTKELELINPASLDKILVKLLICDIFGQKTKFNKSLHATNYAGAEAAILVADATRLKETLYALRDKWAKDFYETLGKQVPVTLLINKCDLEAVRYSRLLTIRREFEEVGYIVAGQYKTSAKTGENVEETFRTTARSTIADLLNGGNSNG